VQQDEVGDGCYEQHDLEQANGFQQQTSAKSLHRPPAVASPSGA